MFKVIVAGTVIGTYNTRAEAEARLAEAKKSYLALVHPSECFRIAEA